MSNPKNNDPFQVWNGFDRDNPFAAHNGFDRDDPFKPWNDTFGRDDQLNNEERRSYGLPPKRSRWDDNDYDNF